MEPIASSGLLRVVLSFERGGSPAKAARALAVAPSTVYRMIARAEASVGAPLFARTSGRWTPTPVGRRMCAIASELERQLAIAEHQITGLVPTARKAIRISASDGFAEGYLVPVLQRLLGDNPGLRIELVVDNQLADLDNFEADIAIRPDQRPGEKLFGRRACQLEHALYLAADRANRHGLPRTIAELAGHDVCLLSERLAHFTARSWWIRNAAALVPRSRIAVGTEMALAAAVEAGLGVGLLPRYIGDRRSGLVRLAGIPVGPPTDIWIVASLALKSNRSVRALIAALAKAIRSDAGLFRSG